MCGRFSFLATEQGLITEARAERFEGRDRFASRHEVRPTTQVPVLLRAKDGARELRCMRWGLIAPWLRRGGGDGGDDARRKDPPVINARSEEIETKPTFRNALTNGQRCVVYTTGYYEWKTDHTGKTPYLIGYQGGTRSLRLAALWEYNPKAPQGVGQDSHYTFTLVTISCSRELEWLHHRMPVILDSDEEEDVWLAQGREWKSLFRSFESNGLLKAQLRTRDLSEAGTATKNLTQMLRSQYNAVSTNPSKTSSVPKENPDAKVEPPIKQQPPAKRKLRSPAQSSKTKRKLAGQSNLSSFFKP